MYADLPTGGIGAVGGLMIGASSTNNLFDDASNGASTTAMYIGNAAITVSSDMRLKRDIAPTSINATELFRKLRVVDYFWNDPTDPEGGRNKRGRWTGMLGQEMVDVVPWIINAPDPTCPTCRLGKQCSRHNAYWFVEYEHLVPAIIKGFQEIDNRVVALEETQQLLMSGNGWFKEQVKEALQENGFREWLREELEV